jgi:hypothetical protein
MAVGIGKGKMDVETYFKDKVFMKQYDPAFRSDKKPRFQAGLPQNPQSQYQISESVPDVVYGYTRAAFADTQWLQVANIGKSAVASNESLVFPYFIVEVVADGPHGGGSL